MNSARVIASINDKISTPCYGCQARKTSCHASCEKYAGYRQTLYSEKLKYMKSIQGEKLSTGVLIESCKRALAKSRYGKDSAYKKIAVRER